MGLYQNSAEFGSAPAGTRRENAIWGCGDHSRFERKTGRQATGIWVYVRGYRYAYNGLPIPQKQGFVARF